MLNWFQTKVAHLLGVVGTDVPEPDLREAMSPHIVCDLFLFYKKKISNFYVSSLVRCQ